MSTLWLQQQPQLAGSLPQQPSCSHSFCLPFVTCEGYAERPSRDNKQMTSVWEVYRKKKTTSVWEKNSKYQKNKSFHECFMVNSFEKRNHATIHANSIKIRQYVK